MGDGTNGRPSLGGSIAALVTPFRDGALDLEAFRRLVRRVVDGGSQGILVLGTTGEPLSLSEAERERLIAAAVETAAGRVFVVAGTGSADTLEAVRRTRAAARLGADAAAVVVPYFVRPSQAGILAHFERVLEASDLPIVVYNIPGRAGAAIEAATVARLREASPRVIGMKETTRDITFVAEVLAAAGSDFRVLAGFASMALPTAAVGGSGVVGVTANLLPAAMARLWAHASAGRLPEARALHLGMLAVNERLVADNPALVKVALARLGLMTAEVRLPMLAADEAAAAALDGLLGGIWLDDEGQEVGHG